MKTLKNPREEKDQHCHVLAEKRVASPAFGAHMGPTSQTLVGCPVERVGARALIEHGCSPGPAPQTARVKLQNTLADNPKRPHVEEFEDFPLQWLLCD